MSKRGRWHASIAPALVFVAVLVAWEVAGNAGLIRAIFFPQPSKIWAALVELTISGDLPDALAATATRFGVGLAIGGLMGASVGLLMGWWPPLHVFLNPFISAVYPIPKIAIFPLLLIVFGIGETSKYIVVGLAAFFPMLITCLAGVRQINRTYLEVGHNYGARGLQVFTRILLPGSLPSLLAGLKLAANMAFVIAIGVEIVSARTGLGVLLWYGWQTFRVAQIYAVLVVIALVGLIIGYLIERVTRASVPWMGH